MRFTVIIFYDKIQSLEDEDGNAFFKEAIWPPRPRNDWHKMRLVDYPGNCVNFVFINFWKSSQMVFCLFILINFGSTNC